MPQIAMTLHDGRAKVWPLDYLGNTWGAYKSTCDKHGARFAKELKAQVVELHNVPELYEALRQAGFTVTPSEELHKRVQARMEEINAARAVAESRAKYIDAKLRERGLSLYGFQFLGVDELAAHPAFILADEMGLGKTVQALAAIVDRAVVVCPATLKDNWRNEGRRFRPDLRFTVLEGRGSFRWPMKGEVVICNYDILPAVLKEKPKSPWKFAEGADPGPPEEKVCLIADEAHLLKNNKAKRTGSYKLISKHVRKGHGQVWLLTGTPMLNHPGELWTLLELADLGREAFASYTNYLRMFNARADGYGGSVQWGMPRPEVPALLRRVMLRREVRDVLPDLPELTIKNVAVPLDPDTRALCDSAMRALDSAGISLEEAIEEAQRFARSGPAFEEISRARAALAALKIPFLLDMVDRYEAEGEPLVVFSCHRAPVDVVAARAGWARISGDEEPSERIRIQDAFQAGVVRGIAMTVQAGGVGLTLTRARHGVQVDMAWTPGINSQAVKRLLRIGQTRGVLIARLVADHPLDERVFEILDSKEAKIAKTVEAARVDAQGNLVEQPAPAQEEIAAPDVVSRETPAAGLATARQEREAPAPERPPAVSFARRPPRDEVELWASSGLLTLASCDADRARAINGVGFNKADTDFGNRMAEKLQANDGNLTDREWVAVCRMLTKYQRQIGQKPGREER